MSDSKPKPIPQQPQPPRLSYREAADWVGNILGRNIDDYEGSHPHFYTWADDQGYGEIDPEGETRGSSQIWFAEYKAHPEGEAVCPPYRNFWHWVIQKCAGGRTNFRLCVSDEEMVDEEEWVQEILKIFRAEFAEHVEDGHIPFYAW